MNIIMLSWEFPPRKIGGISPHVYNLSKGLIDKDVKVKVVTCDFPGTKDYEKIHDVEVYRIDSYKYPAPNFGSWVLEMNIEMQNQAVDIIKRIIYAGEDVVLHAHDWLVANAAIGLKHIFRIPLIVTVHSTEYGRRNGLHTDYERMIHQTEWRMTYEAWKLICCSDYMASQVRWIFNLERKKIETIPNGIDVTKYQRKQSNTEGFRRRFANDTEKIIFYVGRLVYEKGVQVLIDSLPKILSNINAKLIIAGEGYMKENLKAQADRLNLSNKVYFLGFVDDDTLNLLFQTADICVVPSLYEPFGIVALEAMASKIPVVVSETGGLSEIVEHDITGVRTYPDNSDSLAWGITRILRDDGYADWLKTKAYQKILDTYGWDVIAVKTRKLYDEVMDEYNKSSWKPTRK
jgi:glycosyltransferase involved in cell wall biosynthesis